MAFIKHTHTWFAALGISILLIFLCFRPLNAPSYRIIVADGLGYYAYLPAVFIYHDTHLEFKWFDEVFNANYEDHLFEKPTQNFMVPYGNRMINLYYPGQSLLQLPFFLLAHASAKLFHYPPDGFSLPYQLGMGISALFYTLLGLFFCSKLIFTVSQNRRYAILIPLLVFFGTNLFTFSVFAGCYTHCYSFTFITLCLYFSGRFFNSENKKAYYLVWGVCTALVVVFLRPVNCILLVSTLYFFRPFSIAGIWREKKSLLLLLPVLLTFVVLAYNMGITYAQTQTPVANTYTIGRFYFDNWSHVSANFFGFQNGILWYTPLIFLSFAALLLSVRYPRLLFLLAPVLFIILLYSLWFYWNIVNRTLVDVSGIVALLLLQVFSYTRQRPKLRRALLLTVVLCVMVFQLKAYQLRNGILNNNYTYSRYYFRNFFTLHHVDVFPVDPATVLEQKTYFYNFEDNHMQGTSTARSFEGQAAIVLDPGHEYNGSVTLPLPAFFAKPGFKKIKASFWFYRSEKIENVHLVFAFNRKDSTIAYHPFYINTSTPAGRWELKEFGADLPENADTDCSLVMYFWNPDKRGDAFIDDLKLEFILKNGADEITLDN